MIPPLQGGAGGVNWKPDIVRDSARVRTPRTPPLQGGTILQAALRQYVTAIATVLAQTPEELLQWPSPSTPGRRHHSPCPALRALAAPCEPQATNRGGGTVAPDL